MSTLQQEEAVNGTALELREPVAAPALISDNEINRTFRLAKALAMSGMFKDARQAEQAFAKILVGRDLGLSPTQAMMGIHIVEGKPEISANLQASFVKRTPGYDYKILTAPDDDEACEIAYFVDGEEIGRSRFTMDDARKAGLAGRGPWKTYPRNMLFARAMTNGVAFHCPEVTGGIRVYSEGEIGDDEPALPEPAALEPAEAPATAEPESPPEAEAQAQPEAEPQEPPEEVSGEQVIDTAQALRIGEMVTERGLTVRQAMGLLVTAGVQEVAPTKPGVEKAILALTPAQASDVEKQLLNIQPIQPKPEEA